MILDTCALLWLAGGDHGKISGPTLESIRSAMDVYVSAITGFEVGIKYKAGKLQLPAPPQQWFESILAFHNIEVIPLSLEVCTSATELPPIHKDPCDRFIIATALTYDMPVVTADKRFADYGIRTVN